MVYKLFIASIEELVVFDLEGQDITTYSYKLSFIDDNKVSAQFKLESSVLNKYVTVKISD